MTYNWTTEKAEARRIMEDESDYVDPSYINCPIHGLQPVVGNCNECEACLLEQKAKNQDDPDYLEFLKSQGNE